MEVQNPPEAVLETRISISGRPLEDLALEAQLFEEARPAIFCYSWPSPVLVLGYAQPVSDIDLDDCRARGIPVVRRRTGGTGVLHHRDLSLSLVLPAEHDWAGGIRTLYDHFLAALEKGLREAGAVLERRRDPPPGGKKRSPICFEDQLADTLLRDGRKVVGCAQLRKKTAVLIHAAISLKLDVENYAAIFRVSPERIRRGLDEALPGADPEELAGHLSRELASALSMKMRGRPPLPAEEYHVARFRNRAPFLPEDREEESYDHAETSLGVE